jgi:hypothetical protein
MRLLLLVLLRMTLFVRSVHMHCMCSRELLLDCR